MIYVAGEGARTEPEYFRLINKTFGDRPGREKFHLKVCEPSNPNGLRPEAVVDLVLSEAEKKGDQDCEKWAFFDRDAEDNRDTEIPRAMRKASENGVHVALSHPSFEIWLLLHFRPFTSQENGRDAEVIKQLRNHPKADGFKEYDKASGDRGKGLGGGRGEALMREARGREQAPIRNAVRNARKLVTSCPHGDCSPKRADDLLAASKAARADAGSSGETAPESYETWRTRTGHAADCDPLKRDPSSDVWRFLADLEIATEDSY
ncbi:hypothetical protein SMD11_2087 [Streptomyces albireticuli]|uniref:RloB domain-containing protein n=1 Tax=Streptomyces albireticuli TaxID=1940 RepID=A0A1Z2L0A6_9ACTN|nr:hypothetical protein SMD11_2087 [Streptomyces albireticuli]